MNQQFRVKGFDLKQLEYFCTVARTGSFTKAANDLGIAQPSLSEQIARLERKRQANTIRTGQAAWSLANRS
jgi:DNA-binding transcriptional LysR family regulator